MDIVQFYSQNIFLANFMLVNVLKKRNCLMLYNVMIHIVNLCEIKGNDDGKTEPRSS